MKFLLAKFIVFTALFYCLLITPSTVLAAQWATVSSKKAVIYTDIHMTSPIGFIKIGKKIRVGSKPKNKGRVLPFIMKKRVFYIKIQDIQTSSKLANLKNASQRIKKQSVEKKSNSRIAATGGVFLSTSSSPDIEGTSSDSFMGGGIQGYYENKEQTSLYRSGVNYFSFSETRENTPFTFSYVSIPIDLYLPLIETQFYELHAYLGVSLIPFAEYKLEGDFTLNGYGGGAQIGSEIFINFSKKWALHIEGGYQYLYTSGFKFPNINNYPANASFIFSGLKLSGSLAYRF